MSSSHASSPDPENRNVSVPVDGDGHSDDGEEILVTEADGLLPSTNRSHDLTRREHGLDNLRLFLTVLLIVHHTAIFYGGYGSPHKNKNDEEEQRCSSRLSLFLAAFNILNQSFVPALFFFLCGRFSQRTLSRCNVGGMTTSGTARRGGMNPKPYIRKRLYRLFVPAILYTLLVVPTLAAMMYLGSSNHDSGILSVYFSHWIKFAGIFNGGNVGGGGPIIWYLAFLSLLEIIAATHPPGERWGETQRRRKRVWVPQIWALVILASFAMRVLFPSYSSENSQDPTVSAAPHRYPPPALKQQLGYLPQYIIAYVAGHASIWTGDIYILNLFPDYANHPRRLLSNLAMWIVYAMVTLILIFSVSIRFSSSSVSDINQPDLFHMTSGFNCTSFLYTIWNEVSFATIAPALIAVFTNNLNFPTRIWPTTRRYNSDEVPDDSNTEVSNDRNTSTLTHTHENNRSHLLSRYSYGVILLHPLISLAVELVMNTLLTGSINGCPKSNPALITCLTGTINVLVSFLAAWATIRFTPGVGGII